MKKFYIRTFGCQMNFHDSEKAAGLLKEEGFTPIEDHTEADLIVLNTCSIRQKAEQKFLSELGRLKKIKKQKPALKIAVMGCIAMQMGKELFKRAAHVDYVIGPQNIHALREMLGKDTAIAVGDNPEITGNDLPVVRKEKIRAWVSIMYGCNNFCTYCIVPYTRGREKNRPAGNIIKEIEGLTPEGVKEVTLLGQNVNSYKSDTDFPGLLRRINEIEGLKRIRFVTSHPRDLSDELIRAMKELAKVCEHIHLPLQSGSDRILKLMNRGYKYAEYRGKIEKLRLEIPGISITSDIIAGFPMETEKEHIETVNALKDIEFDGIFAFKFSPRPETSASNMEGHISREVKSERLSEILAIQDGITLKKNKCLEGTLQEILIEGKGEARPPLLMEARPPALIPLTGRTRTNKITNFNGPISLINEVVTVRIKRAGKHSILGEIVL